jgi:hypothetical protein
MALLCAKPPNAYLADIMQGKLQIALRRRRLGRRPCRPRGIDLHLE